MDKEESITIQIASKLMNKSEQFVRIGLQRGLLPFGTAVKLSSRWTYYISPKLFYDYVGISYLGEKNECCELQK